MVAAEANIPALLLAYFKEKFPTFETRIGVPGAEVGLDVEFTVDLIVREKADAVSTGKLAVAVCILNEATRDNVLACYSQFAKLKSESETLLLQTFILAKATSTSLENMAAVLREANETVPSSRWLDGIIVLGAGVVTYGALDPVTQVSGHWLFFNHTPADMSLPALYIKLTSSPTLHPVPIWMYRVSANLLIAHESNRGAEVQRILGEFPKGLTCIDYQYDLEGQFKVMPEDQYIGKKMPVFPTDIVVAPDKVLGQIEYMEWQDGGIMIVTGDIPLDIFLVIGNFRSARPLSVNRKNGAQISCVVPLTRDGYNRLLSDIASRSNFTFRSSRPSLVMAKTLDEGVSTPLIARLHFSLLIFRDQAEPGSVNVDEFDKAIKAIFDNVLTVRNAARTVIGVIDRHIAGLTNGTSGQIQGNSIRIFGSIEMPIREEVEKLLNNVSRTLRVGMKSLFASFGEDLDFFLKKQSTFDTGILLLSQTDAPLAEYLKKSRVGWTDMVSRLRNDELEHGTGLFNRITYRIVSGRIEFDEPNLGGMPVRAFCDFVFNQLAKFVEELTVYLLQKKLPKGFIYNEIPIADRKPSQAVRFQMGINATGVGWQIEYSERSFDAV